MATTTLDINNRMSNMAVPSRCLFLELPVELRLEIYSYAMLDCRNITIGISKLQGSYSDIVHRLYGKGRMPYPGISEHHEPLIENEYRAELLSVVKPATTAASIEPTETAYAHTQTAYHTLSLLNKQIADELQSHFATASRRETSLFVSYPHGLHILQTTTPQLLRQSKKIHLAGTYIPRNYCPKRAARLGPRNAPQQEKLQGDVVPDSEKQLEDLFRSCFGPTPKQPVEKIEMRIYYPGPDAYQTVWGDDSSPLCIALRNVAMAEIDVKVWRGNSGCGAYLSARPTTETQRVVSTSWGKLEEGGRGQPETGSWIVDPHWAECKPKTTTSTASGADVSVFTYA